MKSFIRLFMCSWCIFFLCNCKHEIKLSGNDDVLSEVDLGLSVNWANMNLGAESPENFGKYYALGTVEPYDSIPSSFDLPNDRNEWRDSWHK